MNINKHLILFCLILVCSLLTMAPAQTKLVVLGSGNPNPDPEHNGPGVAIIVNDQAYLVDFGTGIVREAAALTPRFGGEIAALEAKRLNKAFLTHMHADHTIGLPDLLFTPWIMGRNVPLEIYGPEGISHMAEKVLEAYQEDIRYRLYGLEPANNKGWRIQANEIHEEGLVYQDALVKVEAFGVSHGSWPQCFGYRFTTPDKVIVVSGDTKPSDNLVKWSKGADILLHEVYYYRGWTTKDDFWKAYHQANHTSTYELAEIANQVNPKVLVCYHTLYWGGSDQDLLQEITSMYDGIVYMARDGQVFD